MSPYTLHLNLLVFLDFLRPCVTVMNWGFNDLGETAVSSVGRCDVGTSGLKCLPKFFGHLL